MANSMTNLGNATCNQKPSEVDTLPMLPVAKKVEEKVETIALVFCDLCGATYIDGCREHSK
jgi:hypothetical protein